MNSYAKFMPFFASDLDNPSFICYAYESSGYGCEGKVYHISCTR